MEDSDFIIILKKSDTLLDTLQFLGTVIEFFYLYKNDTKIPLQ